MTHLLQSFWPQYHTLPTRPYSLSQGLIAAGVLAVSFLFWSYFSNHFFLLPIQTAFPASFSVVLLFLVGFRYWPLYIAAQIVLLLFQSSPWSDKVLLLGTMYIDFVLISRFFNRLYPKRLSEFESATLTQLLKPCLFSFTLVVCCVWWVNTSHWTAQTLSLNNWHFLAIFFLLGMLERVLSFSLLFGFIVQKNWLQQISVHLPRTFGLIIGSFLYAFCLHFWLQNNPIWLYALFLIIPAFSIPFFASLLNSLWSSLAGILGILAALSLHPLETYLSAQSNHNLLIILMLIALLQNGFSLLRSSFYTLRAQDRHTQQHTHRHYTNILSHLPIGIFTLREYAPKHYRFDYVNHALTQIFGLSAAALLSNPKLILKLWSHPEPSEALEQIREAFEEGKTYCFEERIRRHDGNRWLKIEFSTARAANGDRLANGIVIDITADKEQSLQLSIAATVVREMHEGLLVLDKDLIIRYSNPAISTLTGFYTKEILNRPLEVLLRHHNQLSKNSSVWALLKEQDSWQGEITYYTRDQSKKYFQVYLSKVLNPLTQSQQYIIMLSDISLFKEREAQLVQLAYFDTLTGLATRRLLNDRLNQAIGYTVRHKLILAVCYVDLDDFKEINDQYGHKAGDQILAEFGKRLRNELRRNDTAARIGGDEFLVVLPNIKKHADAIQAIERLINKTTTEPYRVLNRFQVYITASFGVYFYDGRTHDRSPPNADELTERADQAMYRAKNRGHNQIQYDAPQPKA